MVRWDECLIGYSMGDSEKNWWVCWQGRLDGFGICHGGLRDIPVLVHGVHGSWMGVMRWRLVVLN